MGQQRPESSGRTVGQSKRSEEKLPESVSVNPAGIAIEDFDKAFVPGC
jgi:hypothetical protein